MFVPDQMDVNGEIQIRLGNGHVVPGRIRMDVRGHVALIFDDPEIVNRWLMMSLEGNLVGLRIETLGKVQFDEPRSDGMDFLQEKDGQTKWFHKCSVHDDVVLDATLGTCPYCGAIQLTRRLA